MTDIMKRIEEAVRLREVASEFVTKVEAGKARSRKTYAPLKPFWRNHYERVKETTGSGERNALRQRGTGEGN